MHKDQIFPSRPEKTRRRRIFDNLTDGMTDLFYYDRKEDEDLPVGSIEEAVRLGEITAKEMITIWSDELRKALKGSKTYAFAHKNRPTEVSIWAEPRGITKKGFNTYWVINGHWTMVPERDDYVLVWEGEVPEAKRHYSDAIAWIQGQVIENNS